MKQYRHRRLEWKAFQPKYNIGESSVASMGYVIEDRGPQFYTEQELLALGFEEVKEEEKFDRNYMKFTRDDISHRMEERKEGLTVFNGIYSFLRDHDLLEE